MRSTSRLLEDLQISLPGPPDHPHHQRAESPPPGVRCGRRIGARSSKPGAWERPYVKPRGGEGVGRQVTKIFKGGKPEVTRPIADWERKVQVRRPQSPSVSPAEVTNPCRPERSRRRQPLVDDEAPGTSLGA